MVRHLSPWVILGWRLWEPNISGITGEMTTLESCRNSITITDLPTGGVDDVCAFLHGLNHFSIEEVPSLGMEWAIDGDDITVRHHLCRTFVVHKSELILQEGQGWAVMQ